MTPDDIALFQAMVTKWINKLGLKGWYIGQAVSEEDSDALATTAYQIDNRRADIKLYPKNWKKEYGDEPTPTYIERIAAHECLHILLADMLHMTREAGDRRVYEEERDRTEHAIIRTLEALLVPE